MNVRDDFPILATKIDGKPLVYLDNAATTQKPKAVIDAISHYYSTMNANVHRGVHALSVKSTEAYENARAKIAKFIHAPSKDNCVFVRGTTEAINLVANSYVLPLLNPQKSILITHMEHHANIVPWQLMAEKTGAKLKVVPILSNGDIDMEAYENMLTDEVAFVSFCYASNALGTINPVKKMIRLAHTKGLKVMIDGAQSTAHLPINIQDLDCDFYAFSGHKMYGPTGIGILYAKSDLLKEMSPYQGGGDMIYTVSFEKSTYAPAPYKFEAGTPNIAGAIGLGAAIDYLSQFDMTALHQYEQSLLSYATEEIKNIPGFRVIGEALEKVSVLSLVHDTIHPHDIGTILDTEGIAVRAGHHCAMPLMDFYQIPATVRLSFSFYNTDQDVLRAVQGLKRVVEMFQ
jgi:cysteine desulfurase/selenocysteine lyase